MGTDTPPASLPLSATDRTRLRRHRERGSSDRADLYAVLDAGLICHLGVVAGGSPRVLPTTYARDGDLLYLHGSSANAGFAAAGGTEVCVTVTHFDGLVLARSVFSHSVNYRSAVVLGTAAIWCGARGGDVRGAGARPGSASRHRHTRAYTEFRGETGRAGRKLGKCVRIIATLADAA